VIRVLINGRYLTRPVTGVQRSATEIVRAIDRLITTGEYPAPAWSFTILTPPAVRARPELAGVRYRAVGRTRGVLWEQLELPIYARHGVLLSFANVAPLAARRQCVTIHDASVFAVPETYRAGFRLWYRFLIPALGRQADRILTDSRFSRDELVRWARIPERKVVVIPLAGEHILSVPADTRILDRHRVGSRPYVLAVGSSGAHKNLAGIARAVELLQHHDFDLLVAGGSDKLIFADRSFGSSTRIRHLGYVTDGQLRALYEQASCLIYPSLYEGFGLPPLEAMACGCPVIASNVASLPEVCGDAALYCNPHDPSDIAARLAQVLEDGDLRRELSRRALNQSGLFRWTATAQAVMREVEEIVAEEFQGEASL
jgi:glycosyltransferase involved in cell wall biosynthesis